MANIEGGKKTGNLTYQMYNARCCSFLRGTSERSRIITNEKLPLLEREKARRWYRKCRARGRKVGYAFESYIHASVACCRAGSRQYGFARICVCCVRSISSAPGSGSVRLVGCWNEGDPGRACLEASAAKRLCLADTLWYGVLSRGDVRLGAIY